MQTASTPPTAPPMIPPFGEVDPTMLAVAVIGEVVVEVIGDVEVESRQVVLGQVYLWKPMSSAASQREYQLRMLT